MNDVMKLLTAHKSIRRYKEKPISDALVNEIIRCAQCASTSNFIQAYTIIRVTDIEKKKNIAAVAGGQQWVIDCPLFLVFCADLNRAKLACEMQGKTIAADCTEGLLVTTIDTALLAQNTMIAAESLGMGGVYIGGIRNNPVEICNILSIPENAYPVFGMCLGYPDDDPGKKERLPVDVVLKINSYFCNDKEELKAYDERIKEYYHTRQSSKRDDNWTQQISQMMGKPQRLHMKKFLENQGFMLK